MKLNKKGTTIVELIVCIALLSIVLVFMYQLLANVKFEKNNDYFASKNQEQRIEIIDAMEDLLHNNTKYYANIKQIVNETSTDCGATILCYNDLQITIDGEMWDLGKYGVTKIGNPSVKCSTDAGIITNLSTAVAGDLCTVNIPIYTDNSENSAVNNNTLDDIVFSFKQG